MSYERNTEKNPGLVPTSQGTPTTPQHGECVANLNPERGPLHAASTVGEGDSDTSATNRDLGQTPVRGGNIIGSTGTRHGAGGRSNGYEGGASEEAAKGGDTGKVTRPTAVG